MVGEESYDLSGRQPSLTAQVGGVVDSRRFSFYAAKKPVAVAAVDLCVPAKVIICLHPWEDQETS